MRPDATAEAPLLGAVMELSTERVNGFGIGSIPISKIWQYLDRFDLPCWWEPALLQIDAVIVASSNKESSSADNNAKARASSKAIS